MKMKIKRAFAHGVRVDLPFEIVVAQARATLRDEHFGVMVAINAPKAMREKPGNEIRPYLIDTVASIEVATA